MFSRAGSRSLSLLLISSVLISSYGVYIVIWFQVAEDAGSSATLQQELIELKRDAAQVRFDHHSCTAPKTRFLSESVSDISVSHTDMYSQISCFSKKLRSHDFRYMAMILTTRVGVWALTWRSTCTRQTRFIQNTFFFLSWRCSTQVPGLKDTVLISSPYP